MIPRPIEVALHSFLKPYRGKTFLLAVSGGVDSMALLYGFHQVSLRIPIKIVVSYIHHGGGSPDQVRFRDLCFELVRDECARLGLFFVSNMDSLEGISGISCGSSEADMRHFRLSELARIKKQEKADFVVFAHHADDLLETRLIRLIRGTGSRGFIAMRMKRGALLRPFLRFTKEQLKQYVQDHHGCWVDDPSNSDVSYLRNWIRGVWLPALEKQRPGAAKILAQSLQLLSEAQNVGARFDRCFTNDGRLVRSELLALSSEEKKQVFAIYLQKQQVENYGLSHVQELVKRLDVERKDLTFRLVNRNWHANARHIWCEK